MIFEDLKFKKRHHGGIGATVEFKDVTVSIQAGKFVYSTPRKDLSSASKFSSFEVAIWENSGDRSFVTNQFLDTDDEVAGWTTKEDIEKLLRELS
jgi:hypothetical protein